MFAVLVCTASSPPAGNSIISVFLGSLNFITPYLHSYEEDDPPNPRVNGLSQVKDSFVWHLAGTTGKEVVSIYWGY